MQDLLQKRPLLITTGEPAGIGMDIVLMLADAGKLEDFDRPIWVSADSDAMQARAEELIKIGALKNCPDWDIVDWLSVENESDLAPILAPLLAPNKAAENAFILLNIPCDAPVVAGRIDTLILIIRQWSRRN